jgi:hypothetical protein
MIISEIIQKKNIIEIVNKPVLINIYKSGISVSGDSLWQLDGSTNIAPKNNKKIDAIHLSGVITGGIFQP